MKRFALPVVAVAVLGLAAAAPSFAGTNLVINGDFSTPALTPGGWGLFTSAQVTGWSTTDAGGLMEIDTAGPIGPGKDPFATQSLEVNANNPETVEQTITGLTVGQTYWLGWAYGDRPGSGDESMQVLLNGVLITTDSDTANNSSLFWTKNGFEVVATSTSETLSFVGLADSGQPSYGNEVTDVSLIATPEPSTWLLMISGLGFVAFAAWRQRGVAMPNISAI